MANHSTLQTCHNLLTKQQEGNKKNGFMGDDILRFKIIISFVFNPIALLWNNRDESFDWIQKIERALGM